MAARLVTTDHLRRLATVDKRSLFASATALIDSDEGIIQVPFRVVAETLAGRTKLTYCRLLYTREQFIEDGVIVGVKPRLIDGGDLDARLAVIADGLNEAITDEPAKEAGQ